MLQGYWPVCGKMLRKLNEPSHVSISIIGNAHYIFMTGRYQALVSKLLPESVDLFDDSSWKKGLL
jgi:hypothetical protein